MATFQIATSHHAQLFCLRDALAAQKVPYAASRVIMHSQKM